MKPAGAVLPPSILPASLALALGLALVGGCSGAADTGCKQDLECAGGEACAAGVCVPRATPGTSTQLWAVEVVPRAESPLAPTELGQVAFTGETTLRLDRRTMVAGELERPEPEAADPVQQVATARVVLSLPSAIPGRRDRQFEAQGASRLPREPMAFTLAMPESALGQEARARVIPASPIDRTFPPWIASVALQPTVRVPIPRPTELLGIDGTLQSADGRAMVGFVVRALAGERVVSTIGRTDDLGRFKIRLPRPAASGAPLEGVSVEIAPEATLPRPRMIVRGLSDARLALGTLRFPPALLPEPYLVPVLHMGTDRRVAGATVRFRTALPGAVGGDAAYLREAQTSRDGLAEVPLIPGATNETRDYSVVVIPPPSSELAARCVPKYAVAAAGAAAGGQRVGAAIELALKAELSGQILSAEGVALAGVRITAVRQPGKTYVEECAADVASPPATATSDREGGYRLLLDPGYYRLEYEPPLGGPAPLHAEENVAVLEPARRMVTLPPGLLVEGAVLGPDGAPVAGAEVRAFGPASAAGGAARPEARSELRARGRSGNDGRFRMVLPR